MSSSRKAGLSPGALVYIGDKKDEKVKISIIDYNLEQLEEKVAKSIEECFPFKEKPTSTWINIDGIHKPEIIEKIGKYFDIHPLILEDILNTGQRPKLEDFDSYIYIVLKMLTLEEEGNELIGEQLSILMGANFVISFQEREGDIFNPIRERIRNSKGRIRKMGTDYLTYTLIDAIVDNYFIILEKFGEKIEDMEEELITNPQPDTLQTIHNLKRDLIFMRKTVWPLREVVSSMLRDESQLIQEPTQIFLKDVYDHTIQVIDTIETYRDMVSGMLDIYLSSISNKMNEVMKVLTIIATIFIPITFIAGIYGMNFEYMPELGWHYSYFAIWGIIILTTLVMVSYFRRKHWL